MPGGSPSITFMTLPVEIRIRIYDYVLVNRCEPEENPTWLGGYHKRIHLPGSQRPKQIRIDPAVLRTCRTVYIEASQILYSENLFTTSDPNRALAFLKLIGPVHTKQLRTLHLEVPWHARSEPGPWLEVLLRLASDATGLRNIMIYWRAIIKYWGPWMRERGLGDDLDFVRALARIQGLRKVELAGYYAKRWPEYLAENMSAQVQTRLVYRSEAGIQKRLKRLRDYQMGTEDLIP